MRRNGFTLIELLAVIVILAVIALIAVPIVINIITDSKTSSDKESMKLYLSTVTKAITSQNLKEKFSPSYCKIQEDSSLICDEDKTITLDMALKENKPIGGTIIFKNGKIIKYKNIKYKDLYYSKDLEGNETITKDPLKSICRSENNVSTELGMQYFCEVKEGTGYNFYVLSKTGYNINLIMDRNICQNGNPATETNTCTYCWYQGANDNSYGPVTVLTMLYNGTKDWNNIPNMNLKYNDDEYENIGEYGYTGIIIENGKGKIINRDNTETILTLSNNKSIKARLPNYSEINKAGCTGTNRSCPTWLVQNLKNVNIPKYESTQKIEGISGYWLLSSRKDTSGLAYFVNCYGNEYYNVGVSHGYSFGARPVITITIDELSN